MECLKKWTKCFCVLAMTGALLTGCGGVQTPSQQWTAEPQITVTDADRNTQIPEPVTVDLREKGAEFRITQPGAYLLSGTMRGSVVVDAQDQIVQLVLSNAEIRALDGPALEVRSAAKVFITLAEGTVNTLRDAASYDRETEADACVYSVCDVTINGSGALNVSGYHQDAIHSKDVLKLLGGQLYFQAKRDGVHGNDGIVVDCPELRVESERHGLNTTKNGKKAKGNVEILGGSHSITAGGYGIRCAQDLYGSDCTVHMVCVLGKMNVEGQTYLQTGCLPDA